MENIADFFKEELCKCKIYDYTETTQQRALVFVKGHLYKDMDVDCTVNEAAQFATVSIKAKFKDDVSPDAIIDEITGEDNGKGIKSSGGADVDKTCSFMITFTKDDLSDKDVSKKKLRDFIGEIAAHTASFECDPDYVHEHSTGSYALPKENTDESVSEAQSEETSDDPAVSSDNKEDKNAESEREAKSPDDSKEESEPVSEETKDSISNRIISDLKEEQPEKAEAPVSPAEEARPSVSVITAPSGEIRDLNEENDLPEHDPSNTDEEKDGSSEEDEFDEIMKAYSSIKKSASEPEKEETPKEEYIEIPLGLTKESVSGMYKEMYGIISERESDLKKREANITSFFKEVKKREEKIQRKEEDFDKICDAKAKELEEEYKEKEDAMRLKYADKTAALEEAYKKRNDESDQIRKELDRDRADLDLKKKRLDAEEENIKQQKETLDEEKAIFTKRKTAVVNDSQSEITEKLKKEKDAVIAVADKQAEFMKKIKAELSAAKKDLSSVKAKLSETKKDLSEAKDKAASLAKKIKESENKTSDADIKEYEDKILTLAEEKENLEALVSELKEKNSSETDSKEIEEALKEANAEKEELKKKINDLEEKELSYEKEINTLKNPSEEDKKEELKKKASEIVEDAKAIGLELEIVAGKGEMILLGEKDKITVYVNVEAQMAYIEMPTNKKASKYESAFAEWNEEDIRTSVSAGNKKIICKFKYEDAPVRDIKNNIERIEAII